MKKKKVSKKAKKSKKNNNKIWITVTIVVLVLVVLYVAIYIVKPEPIHGAALSPFASKVSPSPSPNPCEQHYGKNYVRCPPDGNINKYDCCAEGEVCCHNIKDLAPICCEKDPEKPDESPCGDLGALAGVMGKNANICIYVKCKDPRPVSCTEGGMTICCKADEGCSYQFIGWDVPIAPTKKRIPTCIENDNKCEDNEVPCGTPKEGVQCCRNDPVNNYVEECKEKTIAGKVISICVPIKCPGNRICKGEKEAVGLNICCVVGEQCFHHPNGTPRCI